MNKLYLLTIPLIGIIGFLYFFKKKPPPGISAYSYQNIIPASSFLPYVSSVPAPAATPITSEQQTIADDLSLGPNVLWSAEKINNTFLKKIIGIPGNFLKFDDYGNIIDSNVNINDSLEASASVLWTSLKCNDSFFKRITGEKLAQLGSDGQIHESEIDPSNIMLKIIPKTQNSLCMLNSEGQVSETQIVVDNNLNGPNVLWTSDKIQNFMQSKSASSRVTLSSDFVSTIHSTWLDIGLQIKSSGKGKIKFSASCELWNNGLGAISLSLQCICIETNDVKYLVNVASSEGLSGYATVDGSNASSDFDVDDTNTYALQIIKAVIGGTPNVNMNAVVRKNSFIEWMP